jgi:hypothetical protein
MSDERKPNESNNESAGRDRILSQLVKRACSDDRLKQRMLDDPESVLRENGVEIREGTKPRVAFEKDSVTFEFVPQKAAEGIELTEDAMGAVVGGVRKSAGSTTSGVIFLQFSL